jgi:hypothetical protein
LAAVAADIRKTEESLDRDFQAFENAESCASPTVRRMGI